eukprot:Rmarinus@m.21090
MAFEDDSVFYTFLSTYIILLVLTSAELYHVYRDVTGKHKSRVYILYGLVWINFSMRVVWLFMRRGEWDADYPTLTFVINRFGLIFFFYFLWTRHLYMVVECVSERAYSETKADVGVSLCGGVLVPNRVHHPLCARRR